MLLIPLIPEKSCSARSLSSESQGTQLVNTHRDTEGTSDHFCSVQTGFPEAGASQNPTTFQLIFWLHLPPSTLQLHCCPKWGDHTNECRGTLLSPPVETLWIRFKGKPMVPLLESLPHAYVFNSLERMTFLGFIYVIWYTVRCLGNAQ